MGIVVKNEMGKKKRDNSMWVINVARRLSLAALLACIATLPAHANIACKGSVSYLGLNSDGSMHISVGFGIWRICNFNSPFTNGGVTIESATCRAWYAGILASKASGAQVSIYFTSSANGNNGPECSAIGTWTAPSPLPYFLDVGVTQ
jgi:hypothetical protein